MPRQSIIDIANLELGTIEDPANSNRTKYGQWYGLDGQPWCAMFISWVFWKANTPLGRVESSKGYASCQGGYAFWKANHQLTSNPQMGDIVLYDWNGDGHCDHTGIFKAWIKQGSTFEAIEGNTAVGDDSNGGIVMVRQRAVTSVKAFVSPACLNVDAPAPQVFDDTLRRGDQSARVAKLQKMLYDLKYDIVVDGSFGAQTERAIKSFQKDHNMPTDGISTAAVAGAIQSALMPSEAVDSKLTQGTYLKSGAVGAAVVALQKALNKKSGSTIETDGVFGPGTVAALKTYQTSQNLKPDGIAGPATFGKLGIKNY